VTLSNVQLSHAGIYAVLVTNVAGSALSSNAVLTVVGGSNSCVAVASGAVSWWRAESNANDSVDGKRALSNGVSFVGGEVGQAFGFDGTSGSSNSGIGKLERRDKQQRLDDRGMDQTCGCEYPAASGGMEQWVCLWRAFLDCGAVVRRQGGPGICSRI